jgi:hypothetical protein
MLFIVGLDASGKTTMLYKMKLGGALDLKIFAEKNTEFGPGARIFQKFILRSQPLE